MIKKPLYMGSWKGKVLKAIIIHQAKTWVDIQHYTELSERNLNTALHELQSLKHVVKKEESKEYYVPNSEIIKEYQKFYGKDSLRQTKQGKKVIPRVKDELHSIIQNRVLNHEFFSSIEKSKIEYRFDHFGQRGIIDVIKWVEWGDGITYIAIIEVKSEIVNISETISQIHNYYTYISSDNDSFFGKFKEKKITTYLAINHTRRNVDLLKRFSDNFIHSDIHNIAFVYLEKDEIHTRRVEYLKTKKFQEL